jgi:hypothetical protein
MEPPGVDRVKTWMQANVSRGVAWSGVDREKGALRCGIVLSVPSTATIFWSILLPILVLIIPIHPTEFFAPVAADT